MKIPKTLNLQCLCGGSQTVALTFDVYEAVLPDAVHCDFAYCDQCQAPIAFELPVGLAKRARDRYSVAVTLVAAPLRIAS